MSVLWLTGMLNLEHKQEITHSPNHALPFANLLSKLEFSTVKFNYTVSRSERHRREKWRIGRPIIRRRINWSTNYCVEAKESVVFEVPRTEGSQPKIMSTISYGVALFFWNTCDILFFCKGTFNKKNHCAREPISEQSIIHPSVTTIGHKNFL